MSAEPKQPDPNTATQEYTPPASEADPGTLDTADYAVQVAELEAQIANLKDEWLRAKAETENVRRRSAEEVLKANKFGVEKLAKDLIAVKDSLDAAAKDPAATLETLKSGLEVTSKQLAAVFERFAIAEVDPAGQKFDPNKHQAISQLESEHAPGTVINVLQKGYTLHDRVIRAAMVTVAKGKEA